MARIVLCPSFELTKTFRGNKLFGTISQRSIFADRIDRERWLERTEEILAGLSILNKILQKSSTAKILLEYVVAKPSSTAIISK
jgi:hypothetical protein